MTNHKLLIKLGMYVELIKYNTDQVNEINRNIENILAKYR